MLVSPAHSGAQAVSAWCPFKPHVMWTSMQLANGTCFFRSQKILGDHPKLGASNIFMATPGVVLHFQVVKWWITMKFGTLW
jgi:hypothetical protein